MKMVENWSQLMSQKNDNSLQLIQKSLTALFLILRQYLNKHLEIARIAKVGVLLIHSGASPKNPFFQEIANFCSKMQKEDGGWIDVEDSMWALAYLKQLDKNSSRYELGLNWLRTRQLQSGGWGRTIRDLGRIPITGVLMYLLPELSNAQSLGWLEREWKKEFAINPKLTYKGAYSLMALKSCDHNFSDSGLFDKTLTWLASQQNEDYGWGPCKGHPVGSTPFCTGVALTGLLQYPELVDQNVIANGLKWLEKNQLEDGLWPDHYIEEGSAWSFYALTEGYKFLRARQ